jgi:hypothetical protein
MRMSKESLREQILEAESIVASHRAQREREAASVPEDCDWDTRLSVGTVEASCLAAVIVGKALLLLVGRDDA